MQKLNISDQEKYDELSLYTLGLGDLQFIHQYIVDAYAVQNANEDTKPITLTFALVGLYLHIEKGYTGREVQLAHMQMAKKKKEWPKFDLPLERGDITVARVLKSSAGPQRDEMINNWSRSVWNAYSEYFIKVKNVAEDTLQ